MYLIDSNSGPFLSGRFPCLGILASCIESLREKNYYYKEIGSMRRETGQLEKQQEMVKRDALGLVRFVIKF